MSRRWWTTEVERDAFVTAYKAGGLRAVQALYPCVNERTLYNRAHRLRIKRKPGWSREEVTRLERLVELGETTPAIARKLGRTPLAVHVQRLQRRIGVGVPQGYEAMNLAARRAGLDHITLKLLCHRKRVKIHTMFSPKGGGSYKKMYVESSAVDDVVAEYTREEKMLAAARERDVPEVAMRIILLAHGHERPAKGKLWRLPGEAYDRAAEWYHNSECLRDAGQRLGVTPHAVGRWVRKLGLPVIGRKPCWVLRTDIDTAVRAMRESQPWRHSSCAEAAA